MRRSGRHDQFEQANGIAETFLQSAERAIAVIGRDEYPFAG